MTYVAFDDKMNMSMAVCSSVYDSASRGHVEVVKVLSEYVSNGQCNKMNVYVCTCVCTYMCLCIHCLED